MYDYIRNRVIVNGIDARGVGIKDLILPGKIKDILNQVVEAEKVAQVNQTSNRERTGGWVQGRYIYSILKRFFLSGPRDLIMNYSDKISENIDNIPMYY